MKISGWFFAFMLFVLLFMMVIFRDKPQNDMATQVQALMSERSEVIALADEVTTQRNEAITERYAMSTQMVKLVQENEDNEARLKSALEKESVKQTEVAKLNLRVAMLEGDLRAANVPDAPVATVVAPKSITEVPLALDKITATPIPTLNPSEAIIPRTSNNKPVTNQPIYFVTLLAGMAVMSGGGIVAYLSDRNHKEIDKLSSGHSKPAGKAR